MRFGWPSVAGRRSGSLSAPVSSTWPPSVATTPPQWTFLPLGRWRRRTGRCGRVHGDRQSQPGLAGVENRSHQRGRGSGQGSTRLVAGQQLAAFPLGLLMAPSCRPLGRWPSGRRHRCRPAVAPGSSTKAPGRARNPSARRHRGLGRRRAGAGRRDPRRGARASPRASVRLKRRHRLELFPSPNIRAGTERPRCQRRWHGRRLLGAPRHPGKVKVPENISLTGALRPVTPATKPALSEGKPK